MRQSVGLVGLGRIKLTRFLSSSKRKTSCIDIGLLTRKEGHNGHHSLALFFGTFQGRIPFLESFGDESSLFEDL